MVFWNTVRGFFGGGRAPAEPTRKGISDHKSFFAAQVSDALKATPNVADVRPLPGEFGFSLLRSGLSIQVFLDNLFAETRDLSPEERTARIKRFVGTLNAPNTEELDWEEAQTHLVPLLRASTFFSPAVEAEDGPLRRAALPFLNEYVGIDMDDSIRYAFPRELGKWSVGRDELYAAAHANAARCFSDADVEPYGSQSAYPLWHIAKDDDYQASRLLCAGWLASFRGKVRGTPVAIIPERSTLMVGSGYWRVPRPDFPLYIAFLADVAEAERDALLATFGGRAPWDAVSFQWWSQHGLREEPAMDKPQSGPQVQDLPAFDEIVARMLASIPIEKRLQGVPAEDRVRGLPAEERLKGLTVSERLSDLKGFESLLALPDQVISGFSDDYLRTLPEDVRSQLAQRLGRTLH